MVGLIKSHVQPLSPVMSAPLNFKASCIGYSKYKDDLYFTLQIESTQTHLPSTSYLIERTYTQFQNFSSILSKETPSDLNLPILRKLKCSIFKRYLTSSIQKFEEIDRYLVHLFSFELVDMLECVNKFFAKTKRDLSLNIELDQQQQIPKTNQLKPVKSMRRTVSDPTTNYDRKKSIQQMETGLIFHQHINGEENSNNKEEEKLEEGIKLKRSNSLSMLTRSKSLINFSSKKKSEILPLSIIKSKLQSQSFINKEEKEEDFNLAPWNLHINNNSNNNNKEVQNDEIDNHQQYQQRLGVIAPWNIKNLTLEDQSIIQSIKPIQPKRQSLILLGERGNRLRDYELSMDKLIPTTRIKIKVTLSLDRIIILNVKRSIHFDDLVYKIRSKFLRNSFSCQSEVSNKVLVYKNLQNKCFALKDDEQLVEVMKDRPDMLCLGWVDVNRKLIVR